MITNKPTALLKHLHDTSSELLSPLTFYLEKIPKCPTLNYAQIAFCPLNQTYKITLCDSTKQEKPKAGKFIKTPSSGIHQKDFLEVSSHKVK